MSNAEPVVAWEGDVFMERKPKDEKPMRCRVVLQGLFLLTEERWADAMGSEYWRPLREDSYRNLDSKHHKSDRELVEECKASCIANLLGRP